MTTRTPAEEAQHAALVEANKRLIDKAVEARTSVVAKPKPAKRKTILIKTRTHGR